MARGRPPGQVIPVSPVELSLRKGAMKFSLPWHGPCAIPESTTLPTRVHRLPDDVSNAVELWLSTAEFARLLGVAPLEIDEAWRESIRTKRNGQRLEWHEADARRFMQAKGPQNEENCDQLGGAE